MIRFYSDEFYNNPNIQKQYESDYQNIFSIFASNSKCTKYKEMVTKCKVVLPQLENICKIPGFPKNFNELIILKPQIIAEIYAYYLNSKNITFKNLLDQNFRPQQKDKNGNLLYNQNGNPKYKYILDYTYSEYSEAIAQFFIDNEPNGFFTVSTCNYCNMSYINTFEYINKKDGTKETRRTYDLDHFIPKSKCSLFALCLYNFVPSCKVCNQLKSDDIDFLKLSCQQIEMLFPTSQNYNHEESIKFRIRHKNLKDFPSFGFLKDGNGRDIRNNFNIVIEKDKNSQIYEEHEEIPFKIQERYETHKTEFLNYMEKHHKYPHTFFLLFSQSLPVYNAEELKEAIFNVKLRNNERQIFQKIYNDLDELF